MCPFSPILLGLGSFLLDSGMPINQHEDSSTEVTAELLET